MVFNSFTFAVFFALVYALYLLTWRRVWRQNAILLAASYFFYGWWDWRFLGLIAVSTITDYACGLAIDRRRRPPPFDRNRRTGNPRRACRGGEPRSCPSTEETDPPHYYSQRARRGFLWLSVGVNLGILGFFKYFDFFATGAAELLTALGLPLQPRLLHLILPVGISFYTFQTLSYTIDLYRGHLRATRNLLDFSLFVAFFPQLVAGPIVRACDFLPQVRRPRRLNLETVYEGGYLILWGLVKKVVIADSLAVMVDLSFAPGAVLSGGTALVAVYAFAIQIYCDFSGYSDIARGCAKMMGFDIRLNFRLPYFATNPVEFWRRWHISLSSWLRDYVYIPLGGSRKGKRRTLINLMLTMILGGLWHGAALTFVLWGVYQGLLLVGYRLIEPRLNRRSQSQSARFPRIRRFIAATVFFQFTCLGWLIFRAESVGHIGSILANIATPWPWWILCGAVTESTGALVLIAFTAPLLAVQLAQWARDDLNFVLRTPVWARACCYVGMFYGLILIGGRVGNTFIYFQF